MRYLMLILGLLCSVTAYTASIEGHWQSVDELTGEKLSIVEITKAKNDTYLVVVRYRYPDKKGVTLTHCTRCKPPLKDRPIIGLEIGWGFKQSASDPNVYLKGHILDARVGKVYNGRAFVNEDGRTLILRGYVGINVIGRNQTWYRIEDRNVVGSTQAQ